MNMTPEENFENAISNFKEGDSLSYERIKDKAISAMLTFTHMDAEEYTKTVLSNLEENDENIRKQYSVALHQWYENALVWLKDVSNPAYAFFFVDSHPISWVISNNGNLLTSRYLSHNAWKECYVKHDNVAVFGLETGPYRSHDAHLDVYDHSWEQCYVKTALLWLTHFNGAMLEIDDSKSDEIYNLMRSSS